MSNNRLVTTELSAVPTEQAAFVCDVYELTHALHEQALVERGIPLPAGSRQPSNDVSLDTLLLPRANSYAPDSDFVVAAMAHVLTGHVMHTIEGPLAAMGERARRYAGVFEALGETGLRRHLALQMYAITSRLSGEQMYGPDRTAQTKAVALADYNTTAGMWNLSFGNLWLRLTDNRTRRVIKHVIFGTEAPR